jgi:hypothetical protein
MYILQMKTTQPDISIVPFGKQGTNPIPILEKLWEFYSSKGIKTVFVSIGSSTSPLAELEIAETLGCPVHVVEPVSEKRDLWDKVNTILKNRKDTEETTCDYTKEVVNKWVLSKNVKISSKVPFFYNGTIDLSGQHFETIQIDEFVNTICSNMNISQDNNRIDLLNVQIKNNIEESIIYCLTNSKYRPGLISIDYTNTPDSNLITTQLAGHLQNLGYMLVSKNASKFLYVYNDKNVYEFSSYETLNVDNPLVYELLKASGFYSENSEEKETQKEVDA